MDLKLPNLPYMYFRKVVRKDQGDVSLDGAMIRLLLAIDEDKSIAEVAEATSMDLKTLRQVLEKLVLLGLVETVKKSGPLLDRSFLDHLRRNLAKAVGPIGEFLVEDAASALGFSPNEIPVSRAPNLIEALSREIPDEQMCLEFKRSMIPLIPKR